MQNYLRRNKVSICHALVLHQSPLRSDNRNVEGYYFAPHYYTLLGSHQIWLYYHIHRLWIKDINVVYDGTNSTGKLT